MPSATKPTFFSTPQEFRAWLLRHHRTAGELLVGFHKETDSRTPSMTWPQAVDQALCFGWIDGVRRRIDSARYSIRFAPRRAGSTWSAVNIKRIAVLESKGSMRAAGRAAFAGRAEKKSGTYSYERREAAELDAALEKELKSNKAAWTFFRAQAPSYQRKAVHWVVSAKTQDVRRRRLRRLIDLFAQGRKA